MRKHGIAPGIHPDPAGKALELENRGRDAPYSPKTGGCRDGLHVDRVNRNQGAESTLAFLLSLAEMRLAQNMLTSFKEPIAVGA